MLSLSLSLSSWISLLQQAPETRIQSCSTMFIEVTLMQQRCSSQLQTLSHSPASGRWPQCAFVCMPAGYTSSHEDTVAPSF